MGVRIYTAASVPSALGSARLQELRKEETALRAEVDTLRTAEQGSFFVLICSAAVLCFVSAMTPLNFSTRALSVFLLKGIWFVPVLGNTGVRSSTGASVW